jgi:cellulose synthase/poly-beta-1,6-N-acetylglucosamine synthase-like glycosyltransferase
MNYASNWFAAHNVLEYYFWFKSRMHAHMKIGAVPLGGNSVFFRSSDVEEIGGWNENCLCEDADIGLRLSIEGSKMIATYDSRHVTKEETPHSVSQFVKQRTRWCQGFIQILRYGYWKQLGSLPKVLMSLYLLGSPFILVFLVIMGIAMALVGVFRDMPFHGLVDDLYSDGSTVRICKRALTTH